SSEPAIRARTVVNAIQAVWRVGEKLANLFVSVLSTPALAPGLCPWFPILDGNDLVVIDTNVAAVIDILDPTAPRTYSARTNWIRHAAENIPLRGFHAAL